MKSKPIFSIIIPTFNSGTTLNIALSSIVNQSFNDIEILIIDGLSTDNTIEVAKEYQKKFSNIVIKSESDKGIYDAMNKGIQMAKGEWLYFIGSDDSLFNNNILKQVSEIKNLSDYDVIYGNVTSPRFGGIYDGIFTYSKLISKNICHQAMFLHQRVFLEIGSFNLKYKSHADWDHNIRWFFYSKISKKYIDLVIANYADGGYSSLNDDLIFKNDKDSKLLRLGFGKLTWSELIIICDRVINDLKKENKYLILTLIIFLKLILRILLKLSNFFKSNMFL